MKPVVVRKGAAGFTSWVMLDKYQRSFDVGLGAKLSSDGNLTYSVQHTFDDITKKQVCSIARVTTTATVTLANHGLSVGDWTNVENSGSSVLDGEHAVASVIDANSFTYTVANSGAAASVLGTTIYTARVTEHASISGLTASADGNYTSPVAACRLNVSAYTGGFVELTVLQGRA